ncbi:hypothetical protein BKA60DRAFT_595762 [Fusarium oxysporum]|nr:hypothetical protein BKA60DRAFT_595762 [Fusarium oxysporum]
MCWKTTIEERCKSYDDLLRTGFKLDKCAEYEEKGTCENGIRQLSQRVEDECKKCRELREEQERMAALNALQNGLMRITDIHFYSRALIASPIGLPKLNILLNTSRKVTTITTILQQLTQISGTSWISKTMCEYKLNKYTCEDCVMSRLWVEHIFISSPTAKQEKRQFAK